MDTYEGLSDATVLRIYGLTLRDQLRDIQQFVNENPDDKICSLQPMLDKQRKDRAALRSELRGD